MRKKTVAQVDVFVDLSVLGGYRIQLATTKDTKVHEGNLA
jgi:hypothetical protein